MARSPLPLLLSTLALLASQFLSAWALATIPATDPMVQQLGRVFPVSDTAVGLSWLGGGLRVAHTGRVLRATFAPARSSYKVAFYQVSQ